MHPVIKNLLSRKNRSVPVSDGRKIALVLYGGAMSGVQGAGVMIALRELGLANAFDEIYSSSAGFCNASYLLSGNPEEGSSIYYEEFADRKFIDFRKIWEIENVEYAVDCMRMKKPLHPHKILSHPTRLFAQMENKRKETKFLEVHRYKPSHYFTLIKAGIKLPYLSPGAVSIGSSKFHDTLRKENWLKLFEGATHSSATDIVVVYNLKTQYNYVHQHCNMDAIKNNVFEIIPRTSQKISRFETRSTILKRTCLETGTLTKKIFGSKKKINLAYSPSRPD